MMGIEPTTTGATIRGSTTELHPPLTSTLLRTSLQTSQVLSKYCIETSRSFATGTNGAPSRIRTCNLRLRRPLLYPVERWAHMEISVTADFNEHLTTTIAWKSKLPFALDVVGVEGFEPPTSCSQSRRATRLRYTPILLALTLPHGPSQARHILLFLILKSTISRQLTLALCLTAPSCEN